MTLPSSKIYLFQIKISVYVNFRFNLTGSVLFTLQHYNQSEDFDINCSELYFKLQSAGLGHIRSYTTHILCGRAQQCVDCTAS